MKRLFFTLSVLLVASMFLAACGPAPTAVATEAPATAAPATEASATEAPVVDTTALCASDAGGCAVFAAGAPIKIGFAGPMSGDVSAFGIDASQGIDIAFTDAGAFEGHAFVQDPQDDQASPEVGATVAQLFASDPTVVGVVGHLFSGATNAAMPIYEAAFLPMVSPSATGISLTQQGNTVFNRVVGNDKFQGALAANFVFTNLGLKKLAIVHDGGTYGLGLAERTREVFTELGGEVVAFQGIETGGTDYNAVLADVASNSPDALFFGGYTGEAAVIRNQMAGAGMAGATFVSDDGIYGSQFVELAGANSAGVYATSAGRPAGSTAVSEFDAKFLDAYGVATGSLSPYSWYSNTTAMVLVEAIRKVGVAGADGNLYIPRAALVAAVRATSGYQGLIGEITCDPTGECGTGGFAVYGVQTGSWVELAPDYTP